MKKVLNTLLVSGIILGGISTGVVVNAVDKISDNTAGHVTFKKGQLSFVNKEVEETNLVVPTFDFEPGEVGIASEKSLKAGDQANKNVAIKNTVGVADYTGEEQGWTVSVKAGQFKASKSETVRAAKDELGEMIINFSIKATDVTGKDEEKKTEALDMTTPQKVSVTAKVGIESTAIFTAQAGAESAGKFLFDYSETKLNIPQATAAEAKSTVEYKSDLTWNLSQGTKNNGQKSAVPTK